MPGLTDLYLYNQLIGGGLPGAVPPVGPTGDPGFAAVGNRVFPNAAPPGQRQFEPVDYNTGQPTGPSIVERFQNALPANGGTTYGASPAGPAMPPVQPMDLTTTNTAPGAVPATPPPAPNLGTPANPTPPTPGATGGALSNFQKGMGDNYMSLLQAGAGMLGGRNMREGFSLAAQGLAQGSQMDRQRKRDEKKDAEDADRKRQQLAMAKGLADYIRKEYPGAYGDSLATQALAMPEKAPEFINFLMEDAKRKRDAAREDERLGIAKEGLGLQKREYEEKPQREADMERTKAGIHTDADIERKRREIQLGIEENARRQQQREAELQGWEKKYGVTFGPMQRIQYYTKGEIEGVDIGKMARQAGLPPNPPPASRYALGEDGQPKIVPLDQAAIDREIALGRQKSEAGSRAENYGDKAVAAERDVQKQLVTTGPDGQPVALPPPSGWMHRLIVGYDPSKGGGPFDAVAGISEEGRRALAYRSAAASFIAAILRKESGAQVTETEFAREYPTYFPGPGEVGDPAAVQTYARRRQEAIARLKREAGLGPGTSDRGGTFQTQSGVTYSVTPVE